MKFWVTLPWKWKLGKPRNLLEAQNMSESSDFSSLSSNSTSTNSSSSSSSKEPVDEIQKHVIGTLALTPRRKLFEEHLRRTEDNKKISKEAEDNKFMETSNNQQADMRTIEEISEFRKNYPHDCMSSYNRQRLKRAMEREKLSSQSPCDHRCLLFKDLIGNTKVSENKQIPNNQQFPMKTVRFTPDSSLALVHQKFKCWNLH